MGWFWDDKEDMQWPWDDKEDREVDKALKFLFISISALFIIGGVSLFVVVVLSALKLI